MAKSRLVQINKKIAIGVKVTYKKMEVAVVGDYEIRKCDLTEPLSGFDFLL